MGELYDTIGTRYSATRAEDPRIAAAIRAALGTDVRTVVNVGAGTGSYEPRDLDVTAVEPSATMRAQRRGRPAIDARAEALPFADGAFDAAMAVLSDHHWTDRFGGLRELRRVARRRAVVFTFDPDFFDGSWLARDYLPELARHPGPRLPELAAALGAVRIEPVPIPHDCADGFLHAYWRRPHAYLDPVVRANISVFQLLGPEREAEFARDLEADLSSGAWHERNRGVLETEAMDLGYRLLVAET